MDSLTAELHAWKSLTNTCVKGPLTWHSSPSRQGGGEKLRRGKAVHSNHAFHRMAAMSSIVTCGEEPLLKG